MKKFLQIALISVFTLTLSGCFGSSDEVTPDTSTETTTYQNSILSIVIPKDWEIIEEKDFSSRVQGNTVIAFRNNIKNDVFTANINVVTNESLSNKSSAEHAKEIINSEKTTLFDYKELIRETISPNNAGNIDKTEFIVFEARNTADQDLLRYVQTFLVKDEKVYIVTGSYRATEDEKTVQLVQQAVKNFELK